MKLRNWIVTLSLLFFVNISIGQNIFQSIYVNYVNSIPVASNSLINPNNNIEYSTGTKSRPGFSLGYRIGFEKNRFDLSVGLEALILNYEIENSRTETDLSLGGDGLIKVNYPNIKTGLIYGSIPFALNFKLKEASKVGFRIGTSIDYLISKREGYKKGMIVPDTLGNGGIVYVLDGEDEKNTNKSEFNSFNVTGQLGVYYEINSKYKVNLNFNRKLLNIHNDYFLDYIEEDQVKLDLDLYSIRLGLEYRIQ